MLIRRQFEAHVARPMPEYWVADAWQACPQRWPFDVANELPRAQGLPAQPGDPALPFQPLSFRDCMLYERHAIDSTRGYVKRFMPAVYPFTRLYEGLTGRTFPAFKPKPIWYRQPLYYMANHLAFVPSGSPVAWPSYTQALDYELELGFVLSRSLFNPRPQEALDAIGAFVVLCDFSARDVQREEMASGFGPQKAKHFLNSMSAVAVTASDVLPNIHALKASVEIDGKVVVRTSTAGMQHGLGEVLAHIARDERLYPGELFGTGTLPGGSALENGHWLKRGSHMRMHIEGIGELEHTIL